MGAAPPSWTQDLLLLALLLALFGLLGLAATGAP